MICFFRKKSQAGFTMIELIAIVTILGILLLIAIPRYTEIIMFAQNRIDNANAKFLTKISYAIEVEENSFPVFLADFNIPNKYLSKTIEPVNPNNNFNYDNTTGEVTVVQSD